MNMVYCRACGHQIDEEAAFCQKCGAPQNLTLTSQVASIPSPHSLFLNQFFPLSDFFFSSKGRISRVGFIISILVLFVAAVFVGAISGAIGEASQSIGTSILFSFICFPFLVYFLVVSIVKRFHDMGMSGIYFFFCLIPFIGFIPIFFLIFRGSENDNDYGPNLLNARSLGDVKPTIEQPIPNSSFLNISTPDVINESTQNSKSVYSDSQQQTTNQVTHTSPSQPNWGDDKNPLTDHQEQGKNWILIFVAILFLCGAGWYKYHQFKAQAALRSLETISLADAISEIDGYARQCDDTPASHDLCARQDALSNLIENKYRYCWGSSESRDASESMKHWIPCETDLTQDRFKLNANTSVSISSEQTPSKPLEKISDSSLNQHLQTNTAPNWSDILGGEALCANYLDTKNQIFTTQFEYSDRNEIEINPNPDDSFKAIIENPMIEKIGMADTNEQSVDKKIYALSFSIKSGEYLGLPIKKLILIRSLAAINPVNQFVLNAPVEQVVSALRNNGSTMLTSKTSANDNDGNVIGISIKPALKNKNNTIISCTYNPDLTDYN